MAEPVTDLLMMISVDGSNGVPAGSTASVNGKDPMNEGFVAGRFFELEEFGFGMKLESNEGKGTAVSGQSKTTPAGANAATGLAPPKPSEKDFAIWRSVKAGETEPVLPYLCKPEAFTIKRLVDAATPVLFDHCAKRQKFKRAVIIKRYRGQGDGSERGASSGVPNTLTFLRMEFGQVMLTSLDWSDGEVVTETGRFVFQTFSVTFIQQKADGSAGRQIQAGWEKLAKTSR